MSIDKCPHGYFTHSPYNRCPECHGVDPSNLDAVPVIGYGNGWLLRKGDPVCSSCGGPATAGWGAGMSTDAPSLCYVCRIGDNTVEAISRRTAHETRRGRKKIRGST